MLQCTPVIQIHPAGAKMRKFILEQSDSEKSGLTRLAGVQTGSGLV